MSAKNQIKIDSFSIQKMRAADIPTVVNLGAKAQNSFGVNSQIAPTLFVSNLNNHLRQNINTSFVGKSKDGLIFGAVIFKKITTKSAELTYFFFHPDVVQTVEMYDKFLNLLNYSGFDEIFTKVYKKRKRLELYLRYIQMFGFKEIVEDNDEYVKIRYQQTLSYV